MFRRKKSGVEERPRSLSLSPGNLSLASSKTSGGSAVFITPLDDSESEQEEASLTRHSSVSTTIEPQSPKTITCTSFDDGRYRVNLPAGVSMILGDNEILEDEDVFIDIEDDTILEQLMQRYSISVTKSSISIVGVSVDNSIEVIVTNESNSLLIDDLTVDDETIETIRVSAGSSEKYLIAGYSHGVVSLEDEGSCAVIDRPHMILEQQPSITQPVLVEEPSGFGEQHNNGGELILMVFAFIILILLGSYAISSSKKQKKRWQTGSSS